MGAVYPSDVCPIRCRWAIPIATPVAEFLCADVRQLADRIGLRRLTADTLRQWQQQTTLACRIPELRGHDAQVLVACGVTDAEQSAQADADTL